MEIKNKYGYVRVSSKTQESNSSIESQKQQLIQNGIEEENIFVEIGSGANEIKNRSVFQKLINQKLKENVLSLSAFIDKRIFEVMAFPSPEKLNIIININQNIAAGLRDSPGPGV